VRSIGGVERGPAEEALLGLERKELVQRARRSSVEREAEYAFRHLLVRDVAYGQIPRAARADKHRAAAEWVEALGRPEDHAEMLASHYSRALEYARAAGTEDEELPTRTRFALRDAGDRAFALYAWGAAASFYAGALDLWPRDDPERPHLAYRHSQALVALDGSGMELAIAALDDLEALGDAEAAAGAAVWIATVGWLRTEPDKRNAYLDRALALVGDRPDSPSRVAAIAARAAGASYDGRFSEALEYVDEALPAAERLGLARPARGCSSSVGSPARAWATRPDSPTSSRRSRSPRRRGRRTSFKTP
jgi:tetratricopeptide (TPR) repeat protein